MSEKLAKLIKEPSIANSPADLPAGITSYDLLISDKRMSNREWVIRNWDRMDGVAQGLAMDLHTGLEDDVMS